jgi:hypothetical protein
MLRTTGTCARRQPNRYRYLYPMRCFILRAFAATLNPQTALALPPAMNHLLSIGIGGPGASSADISFRCDATQR